MSASENPVKFREDMEFHSPKRGVMSASQLWNYAGDVFHSPKRGVMSATESAPYGDVIHVSFP